MNTPLVNKVAASGIITLDPMDLFPGESVVFDLKDHLYMGMILKEKPFREALKNLDTSIYDQLTVTVTCSADAIIPKWAYMLVVQTLQPVAKKVFFGSREDAITLGWLENVRLMDLSPYQDQRVVLKGCGDKEVPEAVYMAFTERLLPVVRSLMYGEPCSTVPVYKRK